MLGRQGQERNSSPSWQNDDTPVRTPNDANGVMQCHPSSAIVAEKMADAPLRYHDGSVLVAFTVHKRHKPCTTLDSSHNRATRLQGETPTWKGPKTVGAVRRDKPKRALDFSTDEVQVPSHTNVASPLEDYSFDCSNATTPTKGLVKDGSNHASNKPGRSIDQKALS